MYPIRDFNYDKRFQKYKKDGCSCIILYLYDEKHALTITKKDFDEFLKTLHKNSGTKIDIFTHFSITSSNLTQKDDQEKEQALSKMQSIAKQLDCENYLPCLVILDPQNKKPVSIKSVLGLGVEEILLELYNLVGELILNHYDLEIFAKNSEYRQTSNPSPDWLEYIFASAERRSIPTKILFDVIRQDGITDRVNSRLLSSLQCDGYIPVEDFFDNIDRIITGSLPEDCALQKVIDKNLGLLSCQNNMLFPEIKPFIALSSYSYLKTAFFYYDKMERIDKANNESAIEASLFAICLGKVVEDELNRGAFNAFRGAFSVLLPDYYDKYQKSINSSLFTYLEFYIEEKRKWVKGDVSFNKYVDKKLDILSYPKISRLRDITFGTYGEDFRVDNEKQRYSTSVEKYINEAREIIFDYKRNITDEAWNEVFNWVKTINETRNHAVHYGDPISKEEAESVKKAFLNLVNVHFFEVNKALWSLKSSEFKTINHEY